MGAANFIIPFYLQSSLLLPPVKASAVLSSGAVAMGIFGPFAGRFLDRFGPLRAIRSSLVTMSLGMLCYLMLPFPVPDEHAAFTVMWLVVCAQFIIGAGSVLFSGAVTYSCLRATQKEKWGVVSSLQSVNLMVGTALGACVAGNLVGSGGGGSGETMLSQINPFLMLFGMITAIFVGLSVFSMLKNRQHYEALLD